MRNIFKIHKEERWGAWVALTVFTALNALNVITYWSSLTSVDNNTWGKFIKGYHLAGFDPITYSVLTKWTIGYNIYRHPLLPYFMWPFSKLNEGLMEVVNFNFATFIVALLLIFCAFYAYVFLNRIFVEVIGVRRSEGYVLSALAFGFGYVMLSTLAPDHFCPSMFCLVMTLYIVATQKDKGLSIVQTVLLFALTAGITLSNGPKVFLAAWYSRGKRFFKPVYLLLAVIVPSVLIWWSARQSYANFVWPQEMERKEKAERKHDAHVAWLYKQVEDTIKTKDSMAVDEAVRAITLKEEARKERRKKLSAVYKHTGKPMSQGEFMRWTDVSTSRWDAAVENLFGEGVMIHEDYLLGDVLVNRPVVVHYRNWGNYIVEAFLVLLFVAGIWMGRRSRFLWLALSFFMIDMVLHLGLGFAINEISIMSAHYLFVLPIAMAYVLRNARSAAWRNGLKWALGIVAAYLWIWNVALYGQYVF